MAQTFVQRFAQNVGWSDNCGGIFASVQDSNQACSVLYPFSYSYAPGNNSGSGGFFPFLYASQSCSYESIRLQSCSLFTCSNSSCPNKVFIDSFHASQAIVALGVLSAIFHLAPLAIVTIIYSCHGCCRGEKPGRQMLISILSVIFVSLWFQVGQLIASGNIRSEFEKFNGVKAEVRAGWTLNIVTLCIDASMFIFMLIYFFLGGREKIYCSCGGSHKSKDTTSVVVVTPTPMVQPMVQTTVTQDIHQQPGMVQVQQPGMVQVVPGPMYVPQGQQQQQVFYQVPPGQQQYVQTQQPYVQMQY